MKWLKINLKKETAEFMKAEAKRVQKAATIEIRNILR